MLLSFNTYLRKKNEATIKNRSTLKAKTCLDMEDFFKAAIMLMAEKIPEKG